MYSMKRSNYRHYLKGDGRIEIGRPYTGDNRQHIKSHVFVDDLKMWNRMLTHDEIIDMDENNDSTINSWIATNQTSVDENATTAAP